MIAQSVVANWEENLPCRGHPPRIRHQYGVFVGALRALNIRSSVGLPRWVCHKKSSRQPIQQHQRLQHTVKLPINHDIPDEKAEPGHDQVFSTTPPEKGISGLVDTTADNRAASKRQQKCELKGVAPANTPPTLEASTGR
jgi:hypothetical protein